MKLLKKIGKFLISGLVALKTLLVVKVYALSQAEMVCDYGIEKPVSKDQYFYRDAILTITLPVVMIVGLVVFLIKSKASALKKVVISLWFLIAYILIRIIAAIFFK